MPSFTSGWGDLFKEKVKENAETIEEVADVVTNPSKILDYGLDNLNDGFTSVINLFIVGFIYVVFILIMIFSIYQIFKDNPKPLTDINKITKKTINKYKSVKGGKKNVNKTK